MPVLFAYGRNLTLYLVFVNFLVQVLISFHASELQRYFRQACSAQGFTFVRFLLHCIQSDLD